MIFRKIFIVTSLSCVALPSLFGMRNDDIRALIRQSDRFRYQDENEAIKKLSYEKRLEILNTKLKSLFDKLKDGPRFIDSLNSITLDLYNSLRILWDQETAVSIEEIDLRWLLQQAHLVDNKILLESLDKDNNQKIVDYIAGINNARDKLKQADLTPAKIKEYTDAVVFRYNNLRQLSELTEAQSLADVNEDWLTGLMPIIVPAAVASNYDIRKIIKHLNMFIVAPCIAGKAVFKHHTYYVDNLLELRDCKAFQILSSSHTSTTFNKQSAFILALISFGLIYKAYIELSSRLANYVDNKITSSNSKLESKPVEELS